MEPNDQQVVSSAPAARPEPLTASQISHALQASLLTQTIESNPAVAKSGVGHLVTLWRNDFVLGLDEFGRPALKTLDGRPAAEEIKHRLGSPTYNHFLARTPSGDPQPSDAEKQAELVRRARYAAGLPTQGPGENYVPLGRG